jgi:hypothetical protein
MRIVKTLTISRGSLIVFKAIWSLDFAYKKQLLNFIDYIEEYYISQEATPWEILDCHKWAMPIQLNDNYLEFLVKTGLAFELSENTVIEIFNLILADGIESDARRNFIIASRFGAIWADEVVRRFLRTMNNARSPIDWTILDWMHTAGYFYNFEYYSNGEFYEEVKKYIDSKSQVITLFNVMIDRQYIKSPADILPYVRDTLNTQDANGFGVGILLTVFNTIKRFGGHKDDETDKLISAYMSTQILPCASPSTIRWLKYWVEQLNSV